VTEFYDRAPVLVDVVSVFLVEIPQLSEWVSELYGYFLFLTSFACPKEVTRKGQKKRCFNAQAAPIPAVFLG
jgi:hypothetical protein